MNELNSQHLVNLISIQFPFLRLSFFDYNYYSFLSVLMVSSNENEVKKQCQLYVRLSLAYHSLLISSWPKKHTSLGLSMCNITLICLMDTDASKKTHLNQHFGDLSENNTYRLNLYAAKPKFISRISKVNKKKLAKIWIQ
jgi:hypothetical protein